MEKDGQERAAAPWQAVDSPLQLAERRPFHQRMWQVERLSWIGYGLVLLAALLGFTGAGGMFARVIAPAPHATFDHPRVARWQAAESIAVQLEAGPARRTLLFGPDFAAHFQIEDMQPAPLSSRATARGREDVFAVEAGAPVHLTLHVRAHRPGMASYAVEVDGKPVRLRTLILP